MYLFCKKCGLYRGELSGLIDCRQPQRGQGGGNVITDRKKSHQPFIIANVIRTKSCKNPRQSVKFQKHKICLLKNYNGLPCPRHLRGKKCDCRLQEITSALHLCQPETLRILDALQNFRVLEMNEILRKYYKSLAYLKFVTFSPQDRILA